VIPVPFSNVGWGTLHGGKFGHSRYILAIQETGLTFISTQARIKERKNLRETKNENPLNANSTDNVPKNANLTGNIDPKLRKLSYLSSKPHSKTQVPERDQDQRVEDRFDAEMEHRKMNRRVKCVYMSEETQDNSNQWRIPTDRGKERTHLLELIPRIEDDWREAEKKPYA
jgi:hypothetical protein